MYLDYEDNILRWFWWWCLVFFRAASIEYEIAEALRSRSVANRLEKDSPIGLLSMMD